MASIRERPRKNGTTAYAVLYVIDGRQSSLPFNDRDSAEKFRILVNAVGPHRALEAIGVKDTPQKQQRGITVAAAGVTQQFRFTGVSEQVSGILW